MLKCQYYNDLLISDLICDFRGTNTDVLDFASTDLDYADTDNKAKVDKHDLEQECLKISDLTHTGCCLKRHIFGHYPRSHQAWPSWNMSQKYLPAALD